PLMRDRPFLIEEKYDGERVMLHRRAHELRLFSRNSNDVTSIYGPVALPLLRRCLSPDAPDCIIDGELLVWDSLASRFTDFGSLKTFARYGRSLDPSDSQDHPHHHQEAATPPSSTILTEEVMQANRFKQLCFVAFDVLLIGEQVTMQLPLEARRELLGRLVAVQIPRQFEIISSQVARSTADVIAALDRAIENRCEGIMVKASGSPYVPDERKDSWIKLKPEYLDGVGDDLDLLIVGGYFGTGERHRGTISNFMLGVRAPELSDESSAAASSSSSPIKFYSFCKVGTGYTQIELRALQDMLAPHWHQYDSAHPPSWLELAPPFQEKPDVYILPQFSKVLQIKAAQMVLTNKFRAGYTLRFPRVEKLRLDRSAADCMSHSEIIQLFAEFEGRMAHRCYEEGSGLGIANKRSRRAAAGAAPKGKKQRTVGAQFRATDVSSVAVEDLLFQGLVFCVMSGSEEHSKQELEILVHSHGGTLTQTGQKGVVFCVVAGSETVRVQNLIRADLDIVLPQWLLDCQATRRLIPLEPRYMLAASSATQKNFSQRFDCYGDSYTADTSPETLRSVFQQMEAIRSPPPAAAHTKSVGCSAVRAGSSELVLLDEQHIRKLEDYCISMGRSIQGGDSSLSSSSSSSNGWWRIFSGCVILFDHLVQSSSRPLSRSLQVAKPLCEFYGAKVTTDVLDPSMTHIVCDDKDPGRAQFFQSMKRPSTMLVKVAWIFESVQSHTKLSEQAFHC
ncbi:MAG: ATP-dependent DNA ligase, partial [archaeon]|nr:ATP-dependent DNA ligase [archaeon]